MVARDSNSANAFETTLSVQMGATDLTATVLSTVGGPGAPCYLVIEPEVAERREYVWFDGPFTSTSFATSDLAHRHLAGSAAASGLVHPAGSTVRSAITQQHLEDIHDRIDQRVDRTLVAAKGDLLVGSANDTLMRLGVGSVNDILRPDPTLAGGLGWAAERSPLWLPVGVLANPNFDTGDFLGWVQHVDGADQAGSWEIQSGIRTHAGDYAARWFTSGEETGAAGGYLFAYAPLRSTALANPLVADLDAMSGSWGNVWPRVHPGQVVQVKAWVGKGGPGTHDVGVRTICQFRNANGNSLGTVQGTLTDGPASFGTYEAAGTVRATAPAGAVYFLAGVYCRQDTPSDSVTYYIDSLDIRVLDD